MKKFLYIGLPFLMVMFLLQSLNAQTNVALKIYASVNHQYVSIDTLINNDQKSSTPHSIYEFVSTDTPYVFDAPVIIANSVTLIGDTASNGRPPCIQPNVLTDGSIPGHLFTFTKNSSVVNIQNLYLLGISVNNSVNWGDGFGITITGDSVSLHMNNVVMEQWGQFGINYSGNHDNFWITNCKFRNFVNPGSDYTGEVLRNRNDLGAFSTDTLVMKYNTFIGLNGYVAAPVTTRGLKFFDFEHNTVVGVYKNPFFAMNATNWKCDYNIFYAAYAGGMGNGEYPYWDRIWTPGVGSIIDLDTLSKINAAIIGADTSQASSVWITQAEAKRTIDVSNNIYFTPANLVSNIQKVADTTTAADTIIQVQWMNPLTQSMFANKTTWPGLSANNNLNVDPGFGSGIAEMIGASGTVPPADGIGMWPWFLESRTNGDVATHVWGYQISAPDYSSGNWTPTWPLPEFTSNDLKYSASLTAPDGKPYGDPYWFGISTGIKLVSANVPNKFDLSNNYPNPFNPSTTIKFSLAKSGNVSLKIYNIVGQLVRTVVDNELKNSGTYEVQVNMDNLASGVYFYNLTQGAQSITKKMILLK
jgi:hypothetical protein